MNNKITIILLSVGVIILLFFGINLSRNKSYKQEEFDFSGITRPNLYNESPRIGASNPKVVIFEYADFNCHFCKEIQPVLSKIMDKYNNKVVIIWKDFPFLDESSHDSAIAARCAQAQGKFLEYHNWLFDNQGFLKTISFENGANLLNLDVPSFTSCMLDDKISSLVERDFQEARALNIDATPTIVIGDIALVGSISFEEIDQAILNELK